MLRHVRGMGLRWVGEGCLTLMLICGTCACYITSGGWGAMKLATALKGSFVSKNALGIRRFWFTQVVSMQCGGCQTRPFHVATRVNGQVNPKLMRSIRVWQWRWLNSKENLLEKTGRTLQKGMAMWEKEKITRVFRRKILVNYRTSWKIHLIFPRKIQSFLWSGSIVSLRRKRHFSKTLKKAGAVFPPTGCWWTFQLFVGEYIVFHWFICVCVSVCACLCLSACVLASDPKIGTSLKFFDSRVGSTKPTELAQWPTNTSTSRISCSSLSRFQIFQHEDLKCQKLPFKNGGGETFHSAKSRGSKRTMKVDP